jgi:hypothetical protein
MTRDQILQRYRHLRMISVGHHSAALKFLSQQGVLEHAKRLGLAAGGMLVAESEAEMTLVFDLALYTAQERRSRALDRYARATPLPPGSDAARMLEAMRHARFSVWRINQRHEAAGLIITDVLREAEVWLVDEQLEASAPEGLSFAGRICEPDRFAMSCGVVVPIYRELIEEVARDMLAWRRGDPEHVAQDPRFAIAIYRAAIDSGILNNVPDECPAMPK